MAVARVLPQRSQVVPWLCASGSPSRARADAERALELLLLRRLEGADAFFLSSACLDDLSACLVPLSAESVPPRRTARLAKVAKSRTAAAGSSEATSTAASSESKASEVSIFRGGERGEARALSLSLRPDDGGGGGGGGGSGG